MLNMDGLIINTGNFANVKKYINAGYTPVSIALSVRYFKGLKFPKLAPKKEFLNDLEPEYSPKYNKILDSLQPDKIVIELIELTGSKKIVLLCHEKEEDFCHRQLVAKWITTYTGIKVKELGKMN